MLLTRYPRSALLHDEGEVLLRPLEKHDTDKLIGLFEEVRDEDVLVMGDNVSDPQVLRRWTSAVDSGRTLTIVAEKNNQLVGLVSVSRRINTPHATIGQIRLYIHPDWRNKGLGSQLLEEIIEVGRDLGLEQLVMEIFMENVQMISAFQRRGFEREAILPVYQMVVMRYDLGLRPGRDVLEVAGAKQLPPRRDWPDLIFDESLFEIPDQLNLSDLLDEAVAAGWGHRPAIYFQNEVVSYDLLLTEVQRLASGLTRTGVQAGDSVLLHMPNTPQAIAANLAVQRLGAISVPTPPQLSVRELAFVAEDSGSVVVITTSALLEAVLTTRETTGGQIQAVVVHGLQERETDEQLYSYADLISRGARQQPAILRNRNEIGLLLYTSLSSGRPLGTAHRLDSLLAVLDSFGGRVWKVNEEDVIGSLSPLGFAQGYVTSGLLPFRFGASVALPDDPMAQNGLELAATIRRHHITLLAASPTTYREILANPTIDVFDLASLRLCSSGGEPLTRETYDAWNDRFEQPIFEGFGTTELLYAFLSNAVDMSPQPGSLGRVVPGYQVKIVGDNGNELPTGEIGFLMARGPTGTLYWNNIEAQQRSVRNGWNRMRDYAYRDAEGYFWFVARSDDLIKTRSYRIDPSEVEAVLREHPHVVDAAVIGLPDELRGQRPVACVIPNDKEEAADPLARSILASLRARLADYKIPDEILFVQELPRNSHGHLLRRMLRDQMRRK